MSQTNVIAGALLVGFLIFITTRGELVDYIRLFTARRVEGKSGGGGSLFGIDVPLLGSSEEGEAEDQLIDIGGTAVFGDFWTMGDKFI